MPGSSDDESVDSLDEWLKGGPSSKKAAAVSASVGNNDEDDSDLDSVDREIERMLREARKKSGREDAEGVVATTLSAKEKTIDEKNCAVANPPAAAPTAARASTRTSATPTEQARRGVAWHHKVDTMERKKRRRRARPGHNRQRNIDSDSDDDDDDDDLLEYAREYELSRERKREEEAKAEAKAEAEAERARMTAAAAEGGAAICSANADETRQDCDDEDTGQSKKDTDEGYDEDDIVESDSDVEIIEKSGDDAEEEQYKSSTIQRYQLQRTPSPRKPSAAAPVSSSEVILLDVDSDGDEEIEEPTHPLLSSPPPHMDSSSWHTVRRIQEQDRKGVGIYSPGFSPAKRKRPMANSNDGVDNDVDLARKLQAEEEAAAEAETTWIPAPTGGIRSSHAPGGTIPFSGIGLRAGSGTAASSAAPFPGKGHRLGGK